VTAVVIAAAPAHAETVEGLQSQAASLAGIERQAVLRLFAAETAAARARLQSQALSRRVGALEAELRQTRRYREIARSSLAASRQRVADAIRLLYIDGPPPDEIAVILGASSLDQAIETLDGLRLAADQNHELAAVAERRVRSLHAIERRLVRRATILRASRQAAERAEWLQAAVAADRARYLQSLRARRRTTENRLMQLEAIARSAAAKAAVVQRAANTGTVNRTSAADSPVTNLRDNTRQPRETRQASAPSTPGRSASPDPVSGVQQLVVRVTAYSLPGTTASGLPVGPGIIAVDPTVIPLGTRVYVPGYGYAVAADTGSAVKGNIIDVWLPSLAAARAWGLKTVTITVYRS
jgi:3D (Asp-Asp-Asp) domain-containing protein/peptidoglycan hydrolase CwlO-like protein